ncbi:MAG: ATP F0F1 synthase subunit B [Alphaproteobacteria bacterium]|nr:ATP F0F1 synthase subunit B [Alphaproteobacteria bacterium]
MEEHAAAFAFDATFYALVGLVLFLIVLMLTGAPKMVARTLDERAAKIRKELDDARSLREEAQALLATYQRKQRDAEKEAEAIVERAKAEAKRFAEESRAALAAQVERRTKMAEAKIVQAQNDAVAEVRAVATDLAIAASRRLVADRIGPTEDAEVIARSIDELKGRLN